MSYSAALSGLAAAGVKMRSQRGFYFHGGVPGLKPGGRLLPPAVTGAASHDLRRDVVYCSINPLLSAWFAATYPNGALYMVDPHLPMRPDPLVPADMLGVTCPAATVVAVVEPVVPLESHAFTIEETLRKREAGQTDEYALRVLSAMRALRLDETASADSWAAAPAVPPTWDDILSSYAAAVRRLSPAERDRYSDPGRRVAWRP